MRKFFFVFIIISTSCFEASTQGFGVYHYPFKKYCFRPDFADKIYYGINNLLLVRRDNNDLPSLRSITIQSDSAQIKRVNDSLYLFEPVCKDQYLKIYFADRASGQRIDSVLSYSTSAPFRFVFFSRDRDAVFYKGLLRDITVLQISGDGCTTYYSDWKIDSYSLTLKRSNTTVLSQSFAGGKKISDSFKQLLEENIQGNDVLYATNIKLKNKKGRRLDVTEYAVVTIPKQANARN